VGKVTCFQVPGIDIWFNSNDHLPPHFHAERAGEWHVRVFFLRAPEEMLERKWGKGPSPRDRRLLALGAQVHRSLLLEEWAMKVHL